MTARIWALRALVSAAAAAILVNAAPAQGPAARPAATVNGEPVTFAEVEAVLKLREPLPTELTEAQRRQLQLEALNMLIDDLLMRQFLRKNAPPVEPAEVDKRFADFAASLKNQNKTLDDFYRESGQNEATVRTNITDMLRWSAYAKLRLTDPVVQQYYLENKDFFDQVTVKASHIVLRLSPNCTEAERQAARAKLQAIRQQIVSGQIDFASAAKQYSQCPSAPNGGDIGYFPRKYAVDETFARTAFALKKDEVSDVIQTDYGLHLVKATDRKPGTPSDFTKIKEEVREIAAEEMRQNLLAQERKAAKVEINLGDFQGAGGRTGP